MQATVEVVFDHLDASEALRERIHEEVEALEKVFGRFTSCRVVVATPPGQKHKPGPFTARLQINLPGGKQVIIDGAHSPEKAHDDPQVAVHHAFLAAKRQMKGAVDKMQGKVKNHEPSTPLA
jgi:ribosome-associated translation inhibitor RaiA